MNSPLCDDGLDEGYLTLGAAAVEQAVIDYSRALCNIIALTTPEAERTKGLKRRVAALTREGRPEYFALSLERAEARRIYEWLYSDECALYTSIDPNILVDSAEQMAKEWLNKPNTWLKKRTR